MDSIQSEVASSSQDALEPSPAASTAPNTPESGQVKRLIAEARATRELILAFQAAVQAGSYPGAKVVALAKGLAFLEAIAQQNQAHLATLQSKANHE